MTWRAAESKNAINTVFKILLHFSAPHTKQLRDRVADVTTYAQIKNIACINGQGLSEPLKEPLKLL